MHVAWLVFLLILGLPVAGGAATLEHAVVDLQLAGSATASHADVHLPYHWDRLHGAIDGRARFSLTFFAPRADGPQALYIPRIGNAFHIALNGVAIGQMGTPGNRHEDFSKQPHFFPIPAGVLRASNVLDIDIEVQGGRNGGLSPILFGPVDEVRAAYMSRHRWQITGALVIAVTSAILGGLALILWCGQRERLYLYYAASELLWVVYVTDTLLVHSPLPWPWWGVVYFSAYAMSAVLMFKFALQVMDLHRGALKSASDWNLWLSPPVVLIGLLGGMPWVEQVWKIVTDLVSLCIIVTVVRHGIRSKALEQRVLAIGMLVVVFAGIRDDLVLVVLPYSKLFSAHADHFGIIAWARYAWCVFALSLAWVIAERMRKSGQQIAGMNLTLARRLAEREAKLNAIFAQQAQSERQQAMLEERQRIMRDMHDGLGSQLLGIIHLAQDRAVPREVVTQQLRETLDQLKLTVDAMQDTEGDIASLLGALRYRLGPRLAAAGVHLAWSVDALPYVPGWTLQQSRDLQMILFESFSNLIAHSGATEAVLHAAPDAGGRHILIALHDNGSSFDAAAAGAGRGHGIANMQARANRINSTMLIVNTGDGSTTTLCVPLNSIAALQ